MALGVSRGYMNKYGVVVWVSEGAIFTRQVESECATSFTTKSLRQHSRHLLKNKGDIYTVKQFISTMQ